MDADLALFYSVTHPVESHIHGLGPFDLGSAVGESICRGVIRGDACWGGLWLTQFVEDLPYMFYFLAIV